MNCAARLLAPGECYVEVGSYMGASLIGAMRGNDDKEFVAIDAFEWATRASFDANLERFGARGATVIKGDALPKRILIGEKLTRQGFADNGHAGRLLVIMFAPFPAFYPLRARNPHACNCSTVL